ncbi:GpE family phage tail protein [Escherichia coli]|nr:GpE family phage tail protein [Escherichia coli]
MKVGPDFPTVHHARLQLAEWEHRREIVHELTHQQVLVTEVLEWRYKAIQRSGANDE